MRARVNPGTPQEFVKYGSVIQFLINGVTVGVTTTEPTRVDSTYRRLPYRYAGRPHLHLLGSLLLSTSWTKLLLSHRSVLLEGRVPCSLWTKASVVVFGVGSSHHPPTTCPLHLLLAQSVFSPLICTEWYAMLSSLLLHHDHHHHHQEEEEEEHYHHPQLQRLHHLFSTISILTNPSLFSMVLLRRPPRFYLRPPRERHFGRLSSRTSRQ